MVTNAKEVFAQIPSEIHSAEFEGWRGSYKFDVAGQGVWNAQISDGMAAVHQGDAPTDCTIRCDNDDFMKIFNGKQNLLTAWMQGRVEAEGDIALLQRFHGFIRSDDRERQRSAG